MRFAPSDKRVNDFRRKTTGLQSMCLYAAILINRPFTSPLVFCVSLSRDSLTCNFRKSASLVFVFLFQFCCNLSLSLRKIATKLKNNENASNIDGFCY